jgi:hypothetical protein
MELWEAEFGEDFELHDDVRTALAAGLILDQSWHNDVTASFSLAEDTAGLARLWVEPITVSERNEGTALFTVTGTYHYEPSAYEGDDFEAALEAMRRILPNEIAADARDRRKSEDDRVLQALGEPNASEAENPGGPWRDEY